MEKAQEVARYQSRTTHQGYEAAECCSLLTFIVVRALNGDGKKETALDEKELDKFVTQLNCPSVTYLAKSQNEPGDSPDRNWNWRDPKFRYSIRRARAQPGYVGSYAMDAMAMALHCVWTTDSFKDALLKCANLRGDSDSVCSVVGQIAGAIYGFDQIPKDWVSAVLKWDNYYIPLRAYKLYHRHEVVFSKESKQNNEDNTNQVHSNY